MTAAEQSATEAYNFSVCPAWLGWPKEVTTLVKNANAFDDLEEVAAALAADEQRHVLVIYERAATFALARSLETGTPVDQCLKEWMRYANSLSDLLSSHRRQIVLVDAQQACLYACEFCRRMGLEAGVREALEATPVASLDRVAVTLAEACLQRFPTADRLDNWLRASALDLSNEQEDPRSSAVVAVARYVELDTELDRLREMVYDLEQEREKLAAALREQGKTRNKTIKSLRAEIDRLVAENRDIDARRAGAEDWLQGIMASRSYRIMAPLRSLRSMMRSRS